MQTNFLFDLEKSVEYWTSAVNAVSSNPCVGPLPRIKIHRWAHINSKNNGVFTNATVR